MPKVLTVPMQVDAWVVNNALLKPRPDHPEQVIRRWGLDYSQLDNYMSPMPDPFSGEDNGDSNLLGVHVHWTIPAGFRNAMQNKDKDGNPIGNMQFPYVPNRWLVVRYSGPTNQRVATAWVIESDYVEEQPSTKTMLATSKANVSSKSGISCLKPSALSVAEPSPLKTASTAGTSSYPGTQGGQTRIGRCVPLGSWQETASGKDLFLTAVSSGDIHLSSFQPYNENVFSFHDKLDANMVQGQQALSYFIAGWYSNTLQNPLASCQTADQYQDLLKRYRWQTDDTNDIASQLVCHGMVHSIKWDNTPNATVPDSAQNNIHLNDIKVAVGANSIEALSALVLNNNPDLIPKELLDAFNLGLLDKLEATDGMETIAESLQQKEFNSQSGGTIWTTVPKDSQNSDSAASALGLSTDEATQLNTLNTIQLNLDTQKRILAKMQWDLYALWWKQGNANLAYVKPPLSTKKLTQIAQQLDPSVSTSLFNAIKTQQQNVNAIQTQFTSAYNALVTQLGKENKILKAVNNAAFWQPKDPVILVTGIESPWSKQLLNNLPCRDLSQCINSIYLTSDKKQAISTQDIKSCMPPLNLNNIPIGLTNLLTEFFILDPLNAASLASKAGISVDALQKIMSNHDVNSYPSALPYYGLDVWSQAWAPFFLEWEAIWYPIAFENWQFDGNRYHLTNLPPQAIQQQTLNSRTLLTPQASFSFKGQIKRLIDQDPTFKEAFPNWQSLLDVIDKWPVMSLTLSSFHNQLVQRDDRINRIPNTKSVDETNLANLLNEEAQCTPIPGPPAADPFSPPPSTFQPVREGQFYFNRLSIVDRFGQAINVIQSDTAKSYVPILTDTVMPDTNPTSKQLLTVDPVSPLRFIQLTPRVVQAMRLNTDWLLGNDDSNTKPLTTNCQANPIAGWLLPNYLDQGIQIYDPDGNSLGELRLVEDDNGQMQCNWNPAFGNPYATVEDLQHAYPWLSYLLQTFVAKDASKQITNPVAAYNALREIIDQALSTNLSIGSQYNQYLAALVGRPLVLVRSRWQLELAQGAYTDQCWAQVLPNSPTATYANYHFPMQLGNTNLNQDGLIGYFSETDFKQLYSLYSYQTQNSYIQATANHRLNLQPLDPGTNQPLITTALMDPFAKLHAHTDILPVQSLQLPSVFIKPALEHMEVTFRQGSLLTIRTPSLNNASQIALAMPKPTVKGDWSWLEPKEDGSLQELLLNSVDTKARFVEQPNEFVDGWLKNSGLFKSGKKAIKVKRSYMLKSKLLGEVSEQVQLSYSINTAPNPIQVGQSVNLTIVVSNNSDAPVYLQSIEIQLPLGTNAQEISADGASFKANIVPNDIWQITSTSTSGIYTITSKSGKPVLMSTQGISVLLSGGKVNNQFGSCDIAIKETTTADASGNESVSATADLWISKFPSSFYLDNFRVDHSEIKAGGKATLSWRANLAGCSLTLYGDPNYPNGIDVSKTNSYSLILQDNATFNLDALIPVQGENIPYQSNFVTVTVLLPKVSDIKIQYKPNAEKLYLGDNCTLSWTAQYVDYCQLINSDNETVVADHLKPDATGVYQWNISPQCTTTYYAQGYIKNVNPGDFPYSKNLKLPVYYAMDSVRGEISNQFDCRTIIIDKKTSYLYIASNNNAYIYDTLNNNKLLTTISYNGQLYCLALNADGSLLYMGGSAGISIVNTYNGSIIGNINISTSVFSNTVSSMAISSDNHFLYTSDTSSVHIVDLTNKQVVANLAQNLVSFHVALTPDNSLLCCSGINNTVVIIDTTKRQIIATIVDMQMNPELMAINSDSSKLYVLSPLAHTVTVIDLIKKTKLTEITLNTGIFPTCLSLSDDDARLYVGDIAMNGQNAGGKIFVIDLNTNQAMANTLGVDFTPSALALGADNYQLYVAGNPSVKIIQVQDEIIPEKVAASAKADKASHSLATSRYSLVSHSDKSSMQSERAAQGEHGQNKHHAASSKI